MRVIKACWMKMNMKRVLDWWVAVLVFCAPPVIAWLTNKPMEVFGKSPLCVIVVKTSCCAWFYTMGSMVLWGRSHARFLVVAHLILISLGISVSCMNLGSFVHIVDILNGCALIIMIAGFGVLVWDWTFRCLGRLCCMASMLILGSVVYSILPIKYGGEDTDIAKENFVSPIHIANQLVGVTLPSRGSIENDGDKNESDFLKEKGPDITADVCVMRALIGLFNAKMVDAKRIVRQPRVSILLYKGFHFFLWVFFVSLAFSFYSREQLNRLRIKLKPFKRVCVFWLGGNIADLIARDYKGSNRATIVVPVSGVHKKAAADECDAQKSIWIETVVKRDDDITNCADEHYFTSGNAEDNLRMAVDFVLRWMDLVRGKDDFISRMWRRIHPSMRIYVRIDGLSDKMKCSAINWAKKIRDLKTQSGRPDIDVLLFEESDIIAAAFSIKHGELMGKEAFAFVTAKMIGVGASNITSARFEEKESENLQFALMRSANKNERRSAQQGHIAPGALDDINIVLCEYEVRYAISAIAKILRRKSKGRIFVYCNTHSLSEIVLCSLSDLTRSQNGKGIELIPFGMREDLTDWGRAKNFAVALMDRISK